LYLSGFSNNKYLENVRENRVIEIIIGFFETGERKKRLREGYIEFNSIPTYIQSQG
jgi:hypothetical protein